MNQKTLIAALAGGIASFLLGWLIYGIALRGYMDEHSTKRALAIMRAEPEFLYLLAGNLTAGLLMAWALGRMGVSTAMGGLLAGAILAGLIALNYDLIFYALMNMYKGRMVLAVDVVASAVIGAGVGAVAGLVLGMGKKAAA